MWPREVDSDEVVLVVHTEDGVTISVAIVRDSLNTFRLERQP